MLPWFDRWSVGLGHTPFLILHFMCAYVDEAPTIGGSVGKENRKANKAEKRLAKAARVKVPETTTVELETRIQLDRHLEADRPGGDKGAGELTHLEYRLVGRLGVAVDRASALAEALYREIVKNAPSRLVGRKQGGTARLTLSCPGCGAAVLWFAGGKVIFRTWFPAGCEEETLPLPWEVDLGSVLKNFI